jgi:Immunoglobulin domain
MLSLRTYLNSDLSVIFLIFCLFSFASAATAKPSWKDGGASEGTNKGSGKGGGKNKTSTQISDITITEHPGSLSLVSGDSAIFSVSANSSDGQEINYQWHLNGNVINGATTTSLLIESVSLSDQGEYSISLSTPDVTKTTQALLSVEAKPEPEPVVAVEISLHPVSQSAYVQESLTLNVSATGSGTISYQWRKNGTPISGENQSYLAFSSLSVSDSAQYDVLVSNSTGSVVSRGATLTVNPFASIALAWETPAAREDGSLLELGDINNYKVYLSYEGGSLEEVITIPAELNYIELNDMPPGNYQFAIATTDTSGETGRRSENIELVIN